MAIPLNDNLDINAPKLIDARSKRPDGNAYVSKAEVLTLLPTSKRAIGLPVLIGQDYYYFKTGINNESDLHLWTASVPTSIVETVSGNIVNNADPKNPVVDFLPTNYELSQFNNGGLNPFIKQSDISNKVDKIPGMGLSQESFTTAEKSKLETVEVGAQANKIERIYVDGVELPINNKSVFISLPQSDRILTVGSISTSTNILTLGVGFSWILSSVQYQNTTAYNEVIPYTSDVNMKRVDIIVANHFNTFQRIQGTESATLPTRPAPPPNTIIVTTVDVYHDSIGNPSTPTNDEFLPIEGQKWYNTTVLSDVFIPANTTISNFRIIGLPDSTLELRGFIVDDEQTDGLVVRVWNDSDEDIEAIDSFTVGAGEVSIELPQEENVFIKPKEVYTFKLYKPNAVGLIGAKFLLVSVNTASGFIPLTGTEEDNPVTGDVIFENGTGRGTIITSGMVRILDDIANPLSSDGAIISSQGSGLFTRDGNQIIINQSLSSGGVPVGIYSAEDYSNAVPDEKKIYAQRSYVDNTIADSLSNITLEQARQNGNVLEGNILGDEEFDKQGDRKAFAQISDLEDSLEDYPSVATPRTLSSRYKQENVINNAAMEAHGSYPTAVKTSTGDVYVASIDDNGWLYITKITRDGRNYSRKLGVSTLNQPHHETDSHNCPQILLDERLNAEYPIIIFQTNHGIGHTQYWRFQTLDIEYSEIPEPEIIPGTGPMGNRMSYGMIYRWGDKIWLINRPESPTGVGYRSRWRIAVSQDNGDTWSERDIFNSTPSTGTTGQYCTSSKIDNSPLINIVFFGASQGTNRQAVFLQLNMDTNELTNLDAFTIPDIIDFIENETDYINPFEDGLLLYQIPSTSPLGSPIVSTNETGNLFLVTRGLNSNFYAVEFDREDGTIYSTTLIYESLEGFDYQAHVEIANDDKKETYIFEYRDDYTNNDIRLSYGEGRVTKVDFSDLNDIQQEIFLTSSYRLGRAEVFPDYSGIVFSERTWAQDNDIYIRWRSNVIVHHFEEDASEYPNPLDGYILTNDDNTLIIDEDIIRLNVTNITEEFTANGVDRNFEMVNIYTSIENVFINGVRIKKSDYTTISEQEIEIEETVTLLSGDEVVIQGTMFIEQ